MASQENFITRRVDFERPHQDRIRAIATIPSSMLGDALGRRRGLGPAIRPMTSHCRFAGPALTIRCVSGDNLAALVALSSIRSGDVVVIACNASIEAAVIGGNYAALAKARGAVAIVTDGLVRDLDEMEELEIPVFGAGVSPNGPFKNGAGEIGFAVALGQGVVQPGDVLVGDRDGIVCIPHDRIDDAVERAAAVQTRESEMERTRISGEIPAWLAEQIDSIAVIDVR